MSKLQDFLNSNRIDQIEKEIIVSKRIKDDNGEYLKFRIRPITEDELKQARKGCNNDQDRMAKRIAIAGTIDPNFNCAESIKCMGCRTAEEYITKILLVGEIAKLALEIGEVSGFNEFDGMIEEAKN